MLPEVAGKKKTCVACTQPRRVAAMSVATRVAEVRSHIKCCYLQVAEVRSHIISIERYVSRITWLLC